MFSKKAKLNSGLAGLLVIGILCTIMLGTVPAATAAGTEAEISVNVVLTGDPSPASAFTVNIVPENDAPAPDETSKSVTLSSAKSQDVLTFKVAIATPGDYFYRIYQNPESIEGMKCDSTVYEVIISVRNDEAGGFETVITARNLSSLEKPDRIAFTNTYSSGEQTSAVPSTSSVPSATTSGGSSGGKTAPQTGDDSNQMLYLVVSFVSLFLALIFTALYVEDKRGKKRSRQHI